uniref:Uncharacterized protein n=1 Tax=Geospiza parvula TaxID=87175 RepID=A0A8U8BTS9_GEOPR
CSGSPGLSLPHLSLTRLTPARAHPAFPCLTRSISALPGRPLLGLIVPFLPCLTHPIPALPDRPLLGLILPFPASPTPSQPHPTPEQCPQLDQCPSPCPDTPLMPWWQRPRALRRQGLVSTALLQSLLEETGCCLLYVVEDQLEEVERAFAGCHHRTQRSAVLTRAGGSTQALPSSLGNSVAAPDCA